MRLNHNDHAQSSLTIRKGNRGGHQLLAEDVANAVLFAASDKAGYITDSFIETAGGKYCVQDSMNACDAL